MVAYFVRRLLGGIANTLLAFLLLYCFLLLFLKLGEQRCLDCGHQAEAIRLGRISITYALDKPWPLNYLTWLFNPDGTTVQTLTLAGEQNMGGYTPARTVQLVHSSLLAGDFGYSMYVNPEKPTLALYGIEPTPLYSLISAILFSLMLIATLQRRGRPPAIRSTRVPARSRWRPAELWPMG